MKKNVTKFAKPSILLSLKKSCRLWEQIFRHFFCELKGKPMPIMIGLKAKQLPNHRDADMVVSPGQSHQPLTKVKTHTGGRKFQTAVSRSVFMSAGQEIDTQSRTGLGLDR
jgi:hypothetical protein